MLIPYTSIAHLEQFHPLQYISTPHPPSSHFFKHCLMGFISMHDLFSSSSACVYKDHLIIVKANSERKDTEPTHQANEKKATLSI
jgi:hypothetical protein